MKTPWRRGAVIAGAIAAVTLVAGCVYEGYGYGSAYGGGYGNGYRPYYGSGYTYAPRYNYYAPRAHYRYYNNGPRSGPRHWRGR